MRGIGNHCNLIIVYGGVIMAQKQKPSEMLVEKLVEAIESGIQTGKWIRPWKTGAAQNVESGHVYSGNNAMYLALYRAFSGVNHTQYYGTINQWNRLGARVKYKEEGFTLIKNPTRVEKKDANGEVISEYTFWAHFTVFNSTQVEGWEAPVETTVESDDVVRQRFAKMLNQYNIKVNSGSEAYYSPSTDDITMPDITTFSVEDQYWATLAHEAIHWTGHPSRLNRIDVGNHRGEAYAFEELVAELGSVFVASTFGITPESDANILSYLGSWHKQIKEDKGAIRRALSLANQAAAYLGS